MSYMRSPYYVYHDGENIHLPNEMSFKEFDALVMMRMAQLITKGIFASKNAIKNAIKNHSDNFGCEALCRLQNKKGTIDILKLFTKQLINKEKSVRKNNSKCEVSLDIGRLDFVKCGKKATALIKDIKCSGLHEPFLVCKKHQIEFLKGDHYKLVCLKK